MLVTWNFWLKPWWPLPSRSLHTVIVHRLWSPVFCPDCPLISEPVSPGHFHGPCTDLGQSPLLATHFPLLSLHRLCVPVQRLGKLSLPERPQGDIQNVSALWVHRRRGRPKTTLKAQKKEWWVIYQPLKKRASACLIIWTSPDGQHQNQIDYIVCSQRWRSSIQSAKTRPGADCGSDHELLTAKFRLKLKRVGITTRPFRNDLNQIPYEYTVKLRNRFKGRDLIDRESDELWMEVRDIIQETGIKPSPWKRNAKRQNGCLRRPYK